MNCKPSANSINPSVSYTFLWETSDGVSPPVSLNFPFFRGLKLKVSYEFLFALYSKRKYANFSFFFLIKDFLIFFGREPSQFHNFLVLEGRVSYKTCIAV